MNDVSHVDISAVLFYSHIDPMLVNRICAYWSSGERGDGTIGVILESNGPIRYAYISHRWNISDSLHSTTTQKFREYPDFLYQRAVNWVTDAKAIDKINKKLGFAKANAKYGSSTYGGDLSQNTALGGASA